MRDEAVVWPSAKRRLLPGSRRALDAALWREVPKAVIAEAEHEAIDSPVWIARQGKWAYRGDGRSRRPDGGDRGCYVYCRGGAD